jgi:WD40 repeat protein
VISVAVTEDGTRAVSAGGDQTLRVWDLAGAAELARWLADDERLSTCAAVPGDPNRFVYGDSSGVHLLALQGPVTNGSW